MSHCEKSGRRPRARGLGVPFTGNPGPNNAITDVSGIEVGHSTLVVGDSIRTGVTAIWPRGRDNGDPVFGGWFSLNGNGEITGAAWVDESGFVDGPVLLTNTHSVGIVRDAYIRWLVETGRMPGTNRRGGNNFWALPITTETYDGILNDINGFHIRYEHVVEALQSARNGPVDEGSVGAGTGTICYQFKAGIGTASRIVDKPGPYTVGALVQANCGKRGQLTIAGVPIGRELSNFDLGCDEQGDEEAGSIIVVIGTDAPLLPHQAKRLAKRATMGLARTGSSAGNGSGDIFLAFSTANAGAARSEGPHIQVMMLPNDQLSCLFEAAADCTEEAIINSLVAADRMAGINGRSVPALPQDVVVKLLRQYLRLLPKESFGSSYS